MSLLRPGRSRRPNRSGTEVVWEDSLARGRVLVVVGRRLVGLVSVPGPSEESSRARTRYRDGPRPTADKNTPPGRHDRAARPRGGGDVTAVLPRAVGIPVGDKRGGGNKG